jgi:hypothetical protein
VTCILLFLALWLQPFSNPAGSQEVPMFQAASGGGMPSPVTNATTAIDPDGRP